MNRSQILEQAQKYVQKGQWERASELMEQAHSLDSSDPIVTLRLGDLYKKLDRKKDAAEFYCKTADIFARSGQTTKAAATYKMVLRLDPMIGGVHEKLESLTAAHEAARRGQTGIELSSVESPAGKTGFTRTAIEHGSAHEPAPADSGSESGGQIDVYYGATEREEKQGGEDIGPQETIPGLVELGSTVGRFVSESYERSGAGVIDLSSDGSGIELESYALNKESARRAPEAPPIPPAQVSGSGAVEGQDSPGGNSTVFFDDFAADVAAPSEPERPIMAHRLPEGAGREIKFLTDLEEDEIWELLGRMDRQTFGPDEPIIREGDTGDSLYIITSGRVLVTTTKNGMRIRLAELGENDFFGEVSFLTGQPRTADITATETTTVMEFSRFEMDELIKKYPNVERVLRMFQKDRVADTMSTIMTLSEGIL